MVNIGFLLDTVAGAVADHAHDIVKICQLLYFLLIFIDKNDIVPFFDQLGDQRLTYLAAADDDDL